MRNHAVQLLPYKIHSDNSLKKTHHEFIFHLPPISKIHQTHSVIQQKVQWYPDHPYSVIIVNSASSLVLDASEPEVKLREFTGSPLQQWEFECPSQASFFCRTLVQGKYRHVLDLLENTVLLLGDIFMHRGPKMSFIL
ncbi:hypothetical protein Zmor_018883 [Zophobas morio]|uniref:Uncharacterized protein n=1 Tax=Zophobas morio TaxID=2755281 RepID=A0AA38IEX9_9CUCU|nr:hypothetical protein Zmor_018883 [Zophobas morio]